MDIKTLLDIIANQGFPIALSILLIFRIDKFMQEIVIAQKEGYRQILENTKEIHNTITTLNQQNREYYSLCFSEVQKELSGMKVERVKLNRPINKKGQDTLNNNKSSLSLFYKVLHSLCLFSCFLKLATITKV